MQWRSLLERPTTKGRVLKETQIRKSKLESGKEEKRVGSDGGWDRIGCGEEQREIL